jgi:hypothetical protein
MALLAPFSSLLAYSSPPSLPFTHCSLLLLLLAPYSLLRTPNRLTNLFVFALSLSVCSLYICVSTCAFVFLTSLSVCSLRIYLPTCLSVYSLDVTQPVHPPPCPTLFAPADRQEIVLLVAPPSTGKSTLARRFDPSLYTTVNSDTLKTVEKCMAVAGEALRGGVKSVVVDNTNMEQAARARWVAFAREHGVSVSRL